MNTRAATMVLALLIVPVLTLGAAGTQDIGKASRLCQKAERALRSGNLEGAKSQYGDALELVPKFPQAQIGLGQIAMTEQRFAEAQTHFEAARDGFAELGDALNSIQSKRYGQAQRQINEMRDQLNQLNRFSSSPQASIDRTRLENEIERLQAIQPPSDDESGGAPGEVYFYIGNAQFQQGKVDDALGSWQTCAELSPKFAMVYNNLAIAYWKKGEIGKALDSLDRAEELGFPVNPAFREDLEKVGKPSETRLRGEKPSPA